MWKSSFVKYHGTGNRFILVDDRSLSFSLEDRSSIVSLCNSGGADGVILLQPSSFTDFQMRIFNCDGSEAESCGNGLRCLIRFLYDLGVLQPLYRIAVGKRIVEGRVLPDGRIEIDLGVPLAVRFRLELEGKEVHFVDTGVPHVVFFVSDFQSFSQEAPRLRCHPYFSPRGANVNFAVLLSDGSIRVRTFERGVEGETAACGTGAAAVGVVLHSLYQKKAPFLLHFPGGDLEVYYDASDIEDPSPSRYQKGRVYLTGAAVRESDFP